jgi:hypothetical protein
LPFIKVDLVDRKGWQKKAGKENSEADLVGMPLTIDCL